MSGSVGAQEDAYWCVIWREYRAFDRLMIIRAHDAKRAPACSLPRVPVNKRGSSKLRVGEGTKEDGRTEKEVAFEVMESAARATLPMEIPAVLGPFEQKVPLMIWGGLELICFLAPRAK